MSQSQKILHGIPKAKSCGLKDAILTLVRPLHVLALQLVSGLILVSHLIDSTFVDDLAHHFVPLLQKAAGNVERCQLPLLQLNFALFDEHLL